MSDQQCVDTEVATLPSLPRPPEASLDSLCRSWSEAQSRLGVLAKRLDSGLTDPHPMLQALEWEAEETRLCRQQRDLAMAISRAPARSLRDIQAKLSIWRAMVLPGEAELLSIGEADRVVVSIETDIGRLMGEAD